MPNAMRIVCERPLNSCRALNPTLFPVPSWTESRLMTMFPPMPSGRFPLTLITEPLAAVPA